MNKKVILRGASAIMPLCIGDFPFSFIVGALSVSAGMSVWQSTAWSAIVIAGSAQMLALNMLKTGATLGVIIFAIVVPQIKSQACTVAAVVAAVSGVLLVVLPYSLGIVVASVLGVLAGLCVDLAEERKQRATTESDMPLVEALENE